MVRPQKRMIVSKFKNQFSKKWRYSEAHSAKVLPTEATQ